jgi:hypothetical protein
MCRSGQPLKGQLKDENQQQIVIGTGLKIIKVSDVSKFENIYGTVKLMHIQGSTL